MNDRTPPGDPLDYSIPDRVHPRTRYRYAFRISLAISAVLHLIIIALYPGFFSGIPRIGLSFGGYTQPETPQGTELVNIVELPADQEQDARRLPEMPEPELAPVRTQANPRGAAPSVLADSVAVGPPGPTAAERLRPRAQDLRYWAPVAPERTALTEEQILRVQLAARIEAANDSAAMAAERAAESMDWTYTDDDGKQWGVSPGKLHLGDLTLPMPFSFGVSPGQRERAEDRLWAWDEIESSAARGAVSNYWKERDRIIRERMEAQRRADTTKARGSGGGGGSGGSGLPN
jgi:hypothetical protein